MIKSFAELEKKVLDSAVRKKLAVVVAQDEHTLEAVTVAANKGIIDPMLIGDRDQILTILGGFSERPANPTIIDIKDPTEAVQKGADLVRSGEVDCIMKGKLETGAMMKILVNRERGIRKRDTMSLMAMMESPYYHKVFAITDVGLLTYPDFEQKKDMIANAVSAFHALGVSHPKVSILAAVEKVNPKMQVTVDAAKLKEMGYEIAPDCTIEGPISYDLAMDSESAKIKGYDSPVSGDSDILVVPDIVAGNLLAKGLICTGGGKTCGCVLGAMVPLIIISRSASAEDKYMSIVLAALIGRSMEDE